jgi:FeS assembly SUF system protein|tara:strand:- start:759 stop:1169 length:411 start_codon:yes stop_codon:yes gene_type:complete
MSYGMPPHGDHMIAPNPEELQNFVAHAGEPLEPGTAVVTQELVIEALKTVYDPEIPVNIYDLGLVYGVEVSGNGSIRVEMTVTAPACPVAGELPQWVADAIERLEGTGTIEVHLVWDPPWDQSKMTEDAKMALGIF